MILESISQVTDYDALLVKLWSLSEGQRVDFKQPFAFKTVYKKQTYGLVKDILAMANTEGGGFIIIGKDDNQGKGMDCSEEVIASFDPTNVHQVTKLFGRPEPHFSINQATSPEGTKAIVICVKEFQDCIIICGRNQHDEKGHLILQEAAIYIRSQTGDAQSMQVTSEQDMRSLINRSISKSKDSLKGMLEETLGNYLKGKSSNQIPKENEAVWKKQIDTSFSILNKQFPLRGHLFQIVAHPEVYDAHRLENSAILFDRLLKSVEICNGWSFPYPDFELRKVAPPAGNADIIHTSNRQFMEGYQDSVLQLGVSALCIYREELPEFEGNCTPGQPFFMYPLLMTLYRALDFFGRFYRCIPERERLHLEILITGTHGRYPTTQVSVLNTLGLFYNAGALPFAKVRLDFEAERGEFSYHLEQVYTQLLRELTAEMEVDISNEQLAKEVDKIISAGR